MTWQPIATEMPPEGRIVLLFAVTHIKDDGTVGNWKMATGSWHTPVMPERDKEEGRSIWTWDGSQRRTYEVQPTHWMPLPAPPADPQAMPTIQVGDIALIEYGDPIEVHNDPSDGFVEDDRHVKYPIDTIEAIYRDPLWRRPTKGDE